MLAIVTDIGLLGPDKSGEMILTALHPGKTVEQAREYTGWDLKISDNLNITMPVTEQELIILRKDLDPNAIYTKSGA